MGLIIRPITDDGLVGYDQFGQLAVTRKDGDFEMSHFIADVRDKTCGICAHGWEPNSVSMADQLEWDLIKSVVHESCYYRHIGLSERADFQRALVSAHVRFKWLKPIENGYHGASMKGRPWYTAELLDHPVMFKLGARKRVDHVEVIAQGGTTIEWHKEAEEAFKTEDTTKHFTPSSVLLHAWTQEKVREYAKRLAEIGKLQVKKGGGLNVGESGVRLQRVLLGRGGGVFRDGSQARRTGEGRPCRAGEVRVKEPQWRDDAMSTDLRNRTLAGVHGRGRRNPRLRMVAAMVPDRKAEVVGVTGVQRLRQRPAVGAGTGQHLTPTPPQRPAARRSRAGRDVRPARRFSPSSTTRMAAMWMGGLGRPCLCGMERRPQ